MVCTVYAEKVVVILLFLALHHMNVWHCQWYNCSSSWLASWRKWFVLGCCACKPHSQFWYIRFSVQWLAHVILVSEMSKRTFDLPHVVHMGILCIHVYTCACRLLVTCIHTHSTSCTRASLLTLTHSQFLTHTTVYIYKTTPQWSPMCICVCVYMCIPFECMYACLHMVRWFCMDELSLLWPKPQNGICHDPVHSIYKLYYCDMWCRVRERY